MTSCSFEPDANAMVLFDKGVVSRRRVDNILEIVRHKRIKIFNDKGKEAANIRIEFQGGHRDEEVVDVEAETITLNG